MSIPLSQRIAQIAAASVAVELTTSWPAEVAAAQAALETGWLSSCPGNNPFGIKVYPGCPGEQLLETTEYFTQTQLEDFQAKAGRKVLKKELGPGAKFVCRVNDWFATFPDLPAAFAFYSSRFRQGRYLPAWEHYSSSTRDFEARCQLIRDIHSAGYATDPQYSSKCIHIMKATFPAAKMLKAAIDKERKQAAK